MSLTEERSRTEPSDGIKMDHRGITELGVGGGGGAREGGGGWNATEFQRFCQKEIVQCNSTAARKCFFLPPTPPPPTPNPPPFSFFFFFFASSRVFSFSELSRWGLGTTLVWHCSTLIAIRDLPRGLACKHLSGTATSSRGKQSPRL